MKWQKKRKIKGCWYQPLYIQKKYDTPYNAWYTLFTGWCWCMVLLCRDYPVTIDLIVTMSLILPCVITWNPFRLPSVLPCNAMNHLSHRITRTDTIYTHINSISWSWIPLHYQYMYCIALYRVVFLGTPSHLRYNSVWNNWAIYNSCLRCWIYIYIIYMIWILLYEIIFYNENVSLYTYIYISQIRNFHKDPLLNIKTETN